MLVVRDMPDGTFTVADALPSGEVCASFKLGEVFYA
jgi:hypothetical protein